MFGAAFKLPRGGCGLNKALALEFGRINLAYLGCGRAKTGWTACSRPNVVPYNKVKGFKIS